MFKFLRKVNIKVDNEITVRNIQAYMERTVKKFGSGAKVDCPKEFLGKKAFLTIKKDEDYLLIHLCPQDRRSKISLCCSIKEGQRD